MINCVQTNNLMVAQQIDKSVKFLMSQIFLFMFINKSKVKSDNCTIMFYASCTLCAMHKATCQNKLGQI